MLKISIDFGSGYVSYDFPVVPRVGELIEIKGVEYTVTVVKYMMPDRYTEAAIYVYAKK
jgi:hypothetical protein